MKRNEIFIFIFQQNGEQNLAKVLGMYFEK